MPGWQLLGSNDAGVGELNAQYSVSERTDLWKILLSHWWSMEEDLSIKTPKLMKNRLCDEHQKQKLYKEIIQWLGQTNGQFITVVKMLSFIAEANLRIPNHFSLFYKSSFNLCVIISVNLLDGRSSSLAFKVKS